jgi:hypothetical protein
MPPPKLSWRDAIAFRARRHHLHERVPRERLLDVASVLVGLQAQVMSSAELALWARVEDLEPDAVQRALWEDRTLVKMWAMRGTLHLLPASEHGLWRDALRSDDKWRKPHWRRYFGLADEAEAKTLIEAVGAALENRELTREELVAEVVRETGSEHLAEVMSESWGAVLKPPSYQGLLCFAPGDGQKVRFTSPSTWLTEPNHAEPGDPGEAVAELMRRYLHAHGPATRDDVARWWGGTTPAKTERMLASAGAEEIDLEGDRAWMLPEDAAGAAEPVKCVRLLPAFDQYVIAASRHSERLLPDPGLKPRVYRPQGWLTPILCVDGRFDGAWRHERKGKRVVVSIEPWRKVSKATRTAAEREAERLAQFLGGSLELTWTSA